MAIRKEVYNKKFTNAEIAAQAFEVFDTQEEALKSDYLPHNKLRIVNRSTEVIYVYLDSLNVDAPDYVLGADKVLDESLDEGVNFNQVYIKNADAVNAISAGEIFVRVATAREF